MEKYNYTDLIAYKKQLYNTLLSKVGSGELNAYDAILQLNSNNIKCIVTTNISVDSINNIDKCPDKVDELDELDEINDISGLGTYYEYRNENKSAYNAWKHNEKKSKYSKYKSINKPVLNDTSIQNDIWERKPYKIHTDINKQNLSFNIEINKSITVNGLNRKYPITMYYNEWKLLQQHLNNELDKFHEENKY